MLCRCLAAQVHPGEVLFYPSEYWHQTLTISDYSVSMTGTLVDSHCFEDVKKELDKKCNAGVCCHCFEFGP